MPRLNRTAVNIQDDSVTFSRKLESIQDTQLNKTILVKPVGISVYLTHIPKKKS